MRSDHDRIHQRRKASAAVFPALSSTCTSSPESIRLPRSSSAPILRRSAAAAATVETLGFDIVDINLGCPAKKVVKCGGSGLLRDLQQLEIILRAVRAAVRIPLTIKMRAGWDDKNIVAVEVARMAEANGVQAVAVHPRTREQGYSGSADWSVIRRVREAVLHSRDRQRRYSRACRRRSHGRADRLRCRDDRPRRCQQSLDLPPDSAIRAPKAAATSLPTRTAIACFWIISGICSGPASPTPSAR